MKALFKDAKDIIINAVLLSCILGAVAYGYFTL